MRGSGAAKAALALTFLASLEAAAQLPRSGVAPRAIPSLTEPGEELVIRDVSPRSGVATFASASHGGLLLPMNAAAPAEARALKFVELYGRPFGIEHASDMALMKKSSADELGIEHVRLQQTHKGVPVRAAELVVHLKGARVVAANGHLLDELPPSVKPEVGASDARYAAFQLFEKHLMQYATDAVYGEARLEIFNRGLLVQGLRERSHLAWFIEVTGPMLREYVWIDAQTRGVLLHFNQVSEAKSRQIYDSHHTYATGTLLRSEGGAPTGDIDADKAYDYAGITYDYYVNNHGRDSFDNAGAAIISSVHYCAAGYTQGSTCADYQNAGWNGTQMVYADGFASADDVVGHELTHAVTERTANLFYYMQSGALNESYSDIFGETIDLTDGVGNDGSGVRWRIGEDLPNGASRDMLNPTNYFNPGKMSDASYFVCSDVDNGGVHENSGIPNHAYALMVDGGTYNSTTVSGIGLTKAAKIEYRTLSVYLTSGSGFLDNFNALNQSCTDLIGTGGITSSDCTQVTKALQAVEMDSTWPCIDAVKAPPQCASGTPIYSFSDAFETSTANWTITNDVGTWSSFVTDFAKTGTHEAYGEDPDGVSDHRMTMTNAVTIPSGGRLYFDHAYGFESGYDGGVIEYSTNNGATWFDAGNLIDGGMVYNGALPSFFSNPLGGRNAFMYTTYGYTGTRLNLASLAGQSVKFRFRIGSDVSVGALGWVIDNFSIYKCTSVPTGAFYVNDDVGQLGALNVNAGSANVIGNSGVVLTDVARTSSGTMYGIDFDNLYSVNPSTGAATFIGALGAGGSGMNALVANGTGLLAASINTTSLYSINTATGAATALSGTLGFPSMGDLAFHDGKLYAAVMNGAFSDLVLINLSGGSFTATNLGHVTSDNALFGLAEGTDYHLYGVSNRTVLRIDTANPSASAVVIQDYFATGGALDNANGASSPLTTPFTDDVLFAHANVIRAVHITELRNRINALRVARGLGTFSFTDPTLSIHSTKIKAVHVSQLRTALTDVYTAASLATPAFTDASLTHVKVKAVHIMELRAFVRALE